MKKHYDSLFEALSENQFVSVYRKTIDDHRVEGYVVGLSRSLVLLHRIDGSVAVPNGYHAVRLADISRFQIDEGFLDEYLQRHNVYPVKQPEIDLTDMSSLLLSVSINWSLFMIECERVEYGVGFIGQVEKLTKRNLLLKKIDAKAKWIDTEAFKLKDITSVSFGDGYVEALTWMDAHRVEMEMAE